MNEHYIEIKTVNAKMKRMYGDKFTWTQAGIEKRSNGLHVELRFSTRYGQISFSCTLADGVGGCRFKMIGYSHGYRWSTVRIPVTAEQEARLWAKACELADWDPDVKIPSLKPLPPDTGCWYGPDHIKYDKWGARIAFILKWEWWRMHRVKMICNEACANVLLTVWPDLLMIKGPAIDSIDWPLSKDPAKLTPGQFEYQVRHYFYKE